MTIEERIEKLEMELVREKRRNRLVPVIIIMVCLLTGGLFDTAIPEATAQNQISVYEQIIAKKFILVNERNEFRAIMFLNNDEPAFTMIDKNGKYRVSLSILSSNPSLALAGKNGKKSVFGIDEDSASLSMPDKNGKERLILSVSDHPSIMLTDKSGKLRAGMALIDDKPDILLYDENEDVIWRPKN